MNEFKKLTTEQINLLLNAIKVNFRKVVNNNKKVVYDYSIYLDLHNILLNDYFFNKEHYKKEYPDFNKMNGADSLEIAKKYNQQANPSYGMDIVYLLLAELKMRG